MLGWNISIYRQKGGGSSPAAPESPKGTRLAVWQAGWNGLAWLDELMKAGKVLNLGGNGYPSWYTATAAELRPRLVDEPPEAYATWISGLGDIISSQWEGKTVIDREALAACSPDEWLLIEAWDES